MDKFEYVKNNVDYTKLNIVDLVKYFAKLYGANVQENNKFEILEKYIKPTNKTLFILVDGLGYSKVKSLEDNSILKKNCIMPINTVIPTSTACVETSIYTASYPNEHGILGWWSYYAPKKLSYYSLLLLNRSTTRTLANEKFNTNEIFNKECIFDKFNCTVNVLTNDDFIDSDYNKIMCKNINRTGFLDTNNAFSVAARKIQETEKNFTFLYLEELDSISHDEGVNSIGATNVIKELEKGINYLLEKKISDLNIVIVADHGQIDMSEIIDLNKNNDYRKYFYAEPSIDTRTISFFIKKEYLKEFEEKFTNEFKDDIYLYTKKQVEELELFGPGKLNKNIKNSLGEYIAIVKSDKFLACDREVYEEFRSNVGNHSGLTQDEIQIPLIVITKN